MATPIYSLICISITPEGLLPDNFSLPRESEEDGISWAAGAMDGVSLYHTAPYALTDDQRELMERAVTAAAAEDFITADALFLELAKQVRAISFAGELQSYVMDHSDRLDAEHMFQTAVNLVTKSAYTECVKTGLALLVLFGGVEEEVKDAVRRLALYEEFTFFALMNMCDWDNASEEIFSVAKKVTGWGRIHAVDMLEPETDEIRHWLLTEGSVNKVMASYSSLTCWEKSGAESLLFSVPTYEEYEGISFIIEGMLDEGPIPGISKLKDPEKVLLRFLEISENYSLSADDYDAILNVKNWVSSGEEPLTSVSYECDRLLSSPECAAAINRAVKEGKGLALAKELGIPLFDELLECLRNDFGHYYFQCRYLMENDDYVEDTLNVFRDNLPLSEMTGEPLEGMCLGAEFEDYDRLQFIIQELDARPMTGADIIETGIGSRVTRNRYRAAEVLKSWVTRTRKPLSLISFRLHTAVAEAAKKEINEDIRKMFELLLKGRTSFVE